VEASKYIPLWWRHVLTLHTQAGFIQALQGKEIPLFELYALGASTRSVVFLTEASAPRTTRAM